MRSGNKLETGKLRRAYNMKKKKRRKNARKKSRVTKKAR